MHLACISTGGTAACTLALSSFVSPLCTLFLHLLRTSGRVDHTKHVFPPTQHAVGCTESHFSVNFLCPPLDTAARLYTSSFCPANWLTSMPPACGFETKFVSDAVPKRPHASAPPTVAGSHSSLVTVRLLQRIFLHLWASLQRYIQQTRKGQIDATGREHNRRDTRTQNTLQSSRIPSNEFSTERSRWYNV